MTVEGLRHVDQGARWSTWCARASRHRAGHRAGSARPSTTWAAAYVLAALGLRPRADQVRLQRPDVAVPSAICDGSGMGW